MEEWKDVKDYKGLYQVSNLGNIRELKDGRHDYKNYHKNKATGYVSVHFKKYNGKQARNFYVHRLVAQAFIPNPDNKREVNHVNGNKGDNRLCNLEWITSSDNKKHAIKAGLMLQHTENQLKNRSRIGKSNWYKNLGYDENGVSNGTRATRVPIRVTENGVSTIYESVSEAGRKNKHERHFYIRRLNNPSMDDNVKVEYI